MWFSRSLALALLCSSFLSAGYTRRSTITFPAAASGTHANITLASVTVSMADLADVAHGGQIHNATCSHVITGLPCDLIVTDDATCASITGGYKWGFETYDGTAGTARLWVLIPSLGASAVVPYVCFGDPSSTGSTYLGGSVGDEYDSNTAGMYHLPNGSTLSGSDFSANGNNCTPTNTPTAAAGKIDGGMQVTAASSQYCATPVVGYPPGTWSGWVKITTTSGQKTFFGNDGSLGVGAIEIRVNQSTNTISMLRSQSAFLFTSTGTVTANTFSFVTVTCDALGNVVLYIDGNAPETFSIGNGANTWKKNNIWLGANNFGENFTGILDAMRIDSIVRSGDWIAAEYANQSSPPAMSTPVVLGGTPNRTLLGVGK